MAETSLLEAGASAASTAAALENLQVEASCSVCLEYLKEPVIIECGHNFCKACITRWWEDLERDFPCPVCRKTSRYRSLRPNRQLGSMVEIAKQLQAAKRKIRDESLCPQHHEALSLFCYEDQEPVCLICAISHTHRAHTVVPLDDATQEYKEKLQKCLEPLEQKLQEITRCKSSEEKKPGELKCLHQGTFLLKKPLSLFILKKQLLIHSRGWWRAAGSRCCGSLRSCTGGWTRSSRCCCRGWRRRSRTSCSTSGRTPPTWGTSAGTWPTWPPRWRDVKSTLEKCEQVKTMEVTSVPIELEKNFSHFPRQYFALRKILKQLIADVTLDPETAHPNLVLSEDRKSVKFVETRLRDLPDTPRRFTFYPCVLAAQGFTSGRHYWEVEVGDKTHWAVGVCRDSVSRKGELTPLPETGYWRVRLWNGDKYAATTTPFTPLHIKVKPRRVGIFLDYEAGTLSFYNVTDRSHIYTFTDTFTEKLWPLFYPGIRAGRKNAAPLTIRPPTDWE
ncbi:E3 ubiquitin-protein ligase TRIM39 isoform X1 [Dasypus novemcinctus]|uniref:E3 ubiquitin-protein ligase TRIM39 isoform X1 n=1 Tax=Dasypus novemcinctus TaxID=9361 RepID=UPI00265E25FF|nr:E3 ubiquitin-protein ligase TRIM39 isoform X1 [Dasypus novemcinctus]XP_058141474.1 E3 ubiquitin-protein ligase TRIM39 isoform X1 [Dasypus novemcinctus]XP_058141475.1 E3 ubiquitin-protein ligase TRIM39 isoform X1 [Dasypus novemcinctus]